MTVSIIVLWTVEFIILVKVLYLVSHSDLSILVFKLKHIYLNILLDNPVMHNNL